jgi:hypothetical protein
MEPLLIALVLFFTAGIALLRVNISVIEKRVRVLWRMEAKIDLLLKVEGIEFDPYRNLPHEVLEAMARGERVRAMKFYRDASGTGLKQTVALIDEAMRRSRHRSS